MFGTFGQSSLSLLLCLAALPQCSCQREIGEHGTRRRRRRRGEQRRRSDRWFVCGSVRKSYSFSTFKVILNFRFHFIHCCAMTLVWLCFNEMSLSLHLFSRRRIWFFFFLWRGPLPKASVEKGATTCAVLAKLFHFRTRDTDTEPILAASHEVSF